MRGDTGWDLARDGLAAGRRPVRRCYICLVYAGKWLVEVEIAGDRRSCPLEWLDSFCMRNFTNSPEFDDTLPVGEGRLEASFRVDPERFAAAFGAWLTKRGKAGGQPVRVTVRQQS